MGEITKKTNLLRPAVFHHIRILKEAGITFSNCICRCPKEETEYKNKTKGKTRYSV